MASHGLTTTISLSVIGVFLALAPNAQARKEIVLYSFCQTSGCPDGQEPYSPLIQDAQGNLYGTTEAGGNSSNAGTIFELQKTGKSWVFHSLYSFCSQANCTDGNAPAGGLIVDTSGNLYGTTYLGGNANDGVVYELQKSGSFTVMYSFCAQSQCADGSNPEAGLTYQGQQTDSLYDGKSSLYGTTQYGGGANWGAVYTITPTTQESVFYSFGVDNNANDGQGPLAPLIMDGTGNLYGTTANGGATGDGTIYEISPSGSEILLFAFCSQESQDCGMYPGGALLMQADGTLLGTAPVVGQLVSGVIYSYVDGTYSTLANFCPRPRGLCKAGIQPDGALVQDTSGNFYGVAPEGGRNGTNKGTVFELIGSKLKAIYGFCSQLNCTDGATPHAKLLINSQGTLFGTTSEGGAYNGGTIFELR